MSDPVHSPDARPVPARVVELHTDHVVTPPGNRSVTLESVADLLPSIEQHGQHVPGIVYTDAGVPGRYVCVEGNRRLLCCRVLGRPFCAVLLEHPPSDIDLIRLRLTTNMLRKAMTPDEVAADIRRYMAASGATQDAAAEFFGFSAGYVSKLLAPARRLLPELRHLADNPGVCRDVVRIVAAMPTPELQKQLAERVLEDVTRHGKAKRDRVERLATELRGGPAPRKPGRVRAEKEGATLVVPGDWAWDRLAKFLGDLAEVAKREARRDGKPVLPLSALPQLL